MAGCEPDHSITAIFACDPNPTITFDELTDTIVEGLLAPNDGTAGTFMYTLLLLSVHQDVQNQIREDISVCSGKICALVVDG